MAGKLIGLLLTLIAVSYSANIEHDEQQWKESLMSNGVVREMAFRSGQSYSFIYDAQLSTGIPQGGDEKSSLRVQSLVKLSFHNDTYCSMVLSNVRFGQSTAALTEKNIVSMDAFTRVELRDDLRTTLQLPVEFEYSNGLVREIFHHDQDQPWSLNIKRGILNMLQVNIRRHRRLPTEESLLQNSIRDNNIESYQTVEKTLEGECEPRYTIVDGDFSVDSRSKNLTIVKSITLDKCHSRPEIKYNFRFSTTCPGCKKPQLLKSDTVGTYSIKLSNRDFLIDTVMVNSRHVFSPYSMEAGVILTSIGQTMSLFNTEPMANNEPNRLRQPIKTDLAHNMEWDMWKEEFYMKGNSGSDSHYLRKMPYTISKDDKQTVMTRLFSSFLTKLDDGSTTDEEAPLHGVRLIYELRLLNEQEIEEIFSSLINRSPFTVEGAKKVRNVFPHLVASCATKECVQWLTKKIATGLISPMKAGMAIKCLENDRAISKEKIQLLLDLAKSDKVKKSFFLRQSLWLTIGSLINGLCSPNEDILATEYRVTSESFCDRRQKESYLKTLFENIDRNDKWAEQILFIKAISNAGLDLSIFRLEKIITNIEKKYEESVRREAILALRKLVDIMPNKLHKFLLPIVLNNLQPIGVRVSAAYILLQTRPDRAVLYQLTRMLALKPDRQVATFVFNYMDTLANSTNPFEKEFAEDLKLALISTKRFTSTWGRSMLNHQTWHSDYYGAGFDLDIGSLFSNTSFLPKHISATLHTSMLGFLNKHLLTFGMVQDGLQTVISQLLSRDSGAPKSDQRLSDLSKHFGVRVRSHDGAQPRLYVYAKLKGHDYMFLPLVDGVQAWNLAQMSRSLPANFPFNVQEMMLLNEKVYKIPTILGMPLSLTMQLPLIYSLSGSIQASSDRNAPLQANVNVKASVLASDVLKIEIWSPVMTSGLQIVSHVKVHAPIDANVRYESSNKTAIVKLRAPAQKRELISLETRPSVYTIIWPASWTQWIEPVRTTLRGGKIHELSQFEKCLGKQWFGADICISGQRMHVPKHAPKGTPRCPLAGPNKVLVTIEPDVPDMVMTLKLRANLYEKQQETIQPSFAGWKSSSDRELGSAPDKSYAVKQPWKHSIDLELNDKRGSLLKASFVHRYDRSHRYGQANWEMKLRDRLSVCLDSEVLLAEHSYNLQEVQRDQPGKIYSHSKLTWGRTCDESNRVAMQVVAQQNDRQLEAYQKLYSSQQCHGNASQCSPVTQYSHLLRLGDVTDYKVLIEHNNLPSTAAKYVNEMYQYIKNVMYWSGKIESVENNLSKELHLRLNVDPINKNKINVSLEIPKEKAQFYNVPIKSVPLFNLKRASGKYLLNLFKFNRATCNVHNDKVTTFDGAVFATKISKCFHVLAKDCSGTEPQFAVLLRSLADNGESLKEVKVLMPKHELRLIGRASGYTQVIYEGRPLTMNDKTEVITDDQGREVFRLYQLANYLKVELPTSKVFVYFDGYNANVKIARVHLNSQCGLCGHFDGDETDEFRKPNFDHEDDIREFQRSWIQSSSDCSVPDSSSICSNEKCDAEDKTGTIAPALATAMYESDDSMCFSKSPVAMCPAGTVAKGRRQYQMGSYYCFSPDSLEAEWIAQQIKHKSRTFDFSNRTGVVYSPENSPIECWRSL